MLALISPSEKVIDYVGNEGVRICQVESVSFEVAQPLFWTACPNNCVADEWYYIQEQCRAIPQQPNPIEPNPIEPINLQPIQ